MEKKLINFEEGKEKKNIFLFSINKSLLKNQIYMKLFSMLCP